MQLISAPLRAAELFAFGLTCIFSANLIFYAMIGRVNRRLSDSEQIRYVGTPLRQYLGKSGRIRREHKRLYPRSALPQISIILVVAAFALMVAAVFQLPSPR